MAVYKVPQDVEAEDKLIGPFGFRQFIYLLIAAGAGGLTFLFFQAPIPVPFFSIFSVPVIIVMLVLSLPLRKDQPMEIYVAAVLRFMLKPKQRLWMNDGTTVGVIIDQPRFVQRQLTKDLSQDEALSKLDYLSRIVDTRGWAAKDVNAPQESMLPLQPAYANAATTAEDVLDENHGVARSFDDLIAKQKQASHEAAVERMHELGQNTQTTTATAAPAPQQPQTQQQAAASRQAAQADEDMAADPWSRYDTTKEPQGDKQHPRFNPYPNMHQQILSPLDKLRGGTFRAPDPNAQPAKAEADSGKIQGDKEDDKSMTPPVSPDIMRLANNKDLSIQAIANEAHRIEQDDEVVVQLH